MNTLADYGDESDEESPRRRSFHLEPPEVASSTNSQHNSAHSSKQQRSPEHSPRPRRDSDMMFDDGDAMFDEPRRYSSFSDRSDRSDGTEFREPPPPKRKVDHSPSPSLPTPTNKLPQVSSAVSLVSYSGGDDEKEDAFERVCSPGAYAADHAPIERESVVREANSTDRAAENVSRPASPPSGMVEPRPPERVSQESDTDDENERLIDMALEDGRNAMKQENPESHRRSPIRIEDGGSTGSGGWTPRPYDSPLHGVDHEVDPKRVDTPPHQEVTIPPAPTTECDPELIEIFYKHFERKAAGIDVNVSVQERKDFQNPSSYEQLILNFGIDEVATLLHPKLLTVNYPRCCRYEKIAEDQRKHMDSINAAKKAASGGSSSAPIKKKA